MLCESVSKTIPLKITQEINKDKSHPNWKSLLKARKKVIRCNSFKLKLVDFSFQIRFRRFTGLCFEHTICNQRKQSWCKKAKRVSLWPEGVVTEEIDHFNNFWSPPSPISRFKLLTVSFYFPTFLVNVSTSCYYHRRVGNLLTIFILFFLLKNFDH